MGSSRELLSEKGFNPRARDGREVIDSKLYGYDVAVSIHAPVMDAKDDGIAEPRA